MTIDAAALRVVVSADTSDAESGLKSFSGKMSSMAGGLAGVGGVLSATIGAPLIGIGVTAVKTAADFERSMNVLGYATDASAAQMQALSDQALQLGADTVFSANEAAEGMVDLAKAGMDTTEIMGAIPGVMDLAAAGQISVSDAANLTAAALNTFGLQAEDSAKVADVLAAAANASTAEVSDLAFGLQNAGSVFASNGQSVESLATMMALLANNGINASDAATSLKTMTMRLTAPTAAAAKEMKRLGINVFNADGSMRDYHDIVVDLSRAASGLSDEQRNMAFNTLFGADAIRAANILAQEGKQGYEDMAAAVSEQGAASEMANAQNSGLAGAMEQISGSIESLMTKLALPFLDTLSGWMGGLTDFVNQLGDLPQPVINAALAVAGFATALGAVLLAAAGIATVIGALATPIGLVALVVLGLAAAVAGLWVAWETNWGNIQEKTAAVMAVITPLIETLSSNLSSAMTALSNFKMPTLDDLSKLKSDIEVQVNATVKTLLNPPQLTILPFPPMTIDPPDLTIPPIPPQNIKAAADTASRGVGSMIDSLTETIAGGNWAGVGKLLGTMVIAAWNTEVAKIGPFLNFIGVASAFGTALDVLKGNMMGALITFGLQLDGTGIAGKIAKLGETIATALTTMWTNLIATVMGAVMGPNPDALRGRAAGAGFKWSDYIQPLKWLDFISQLAWTVFVEPLAWASWIAMLTWETFIAALTWQSFVPDISWGDFVPGISWGDFIPNIDWGRFVGSLFGGGSKGGGGSLMPPDSGGGGGNNKTGPVMTPEFVMEGGTAAVGTASYGGGFGMGGGVVIRIDNVNVHNDMDIEELAAKLARRFQQRIR